MEQYSPQQTAIGTAGVHFDAMCLSYKDDPAWQLDSLRDIFNSDEFQILDCESEMKPGSPFLNSIDLYFEYRSKIHKFSLLMTWRCQYTVQDDKTWMRLKSVEDYQLTRYLKPKWQENDN